MATAPTVTTTNDDRDRPHDDLAGSNINQSASASTKTTVAFTLFNKKAKKASETRNNHDNHTTNVLGTERETPALQASSASSSQPLVIPLTETASKLHLQRNKSRQAVDDADAAAIQALQDDASKIIRPGEEITIPVDNDQKEREKFRTDLEELPEEPPVDSDVYERVPIADFGAALLRGMGWKGDDDNRNKSEKEDNMVMPRPVRLGLGATPQLKAAITHRAMRPDELKRQAVLEEQQAKAMEQHELIKAKDKQKTLQDGSIVWHGTRRAKLVQLRGVPGLNRVRIVYENDPPQELTAVAKGEITLVPRQDLDDQPFQEVAVTDQINHRGNGNIDERQHRGKEELQKARVKEEQGFNDRRVKKEDDKEDYRSDRRNGNGDHRPSSSSRDNHSQPSKRRRPDDDDRRKDRDGHEERYEKAKDRSSRKRSRHDEENDRKSSKSTASTHSDHHWLISNIRVRVVTEKLGKRYYQEKGVVLDVTRKGAEATVQMADGRILDRVPERYLETALPKSGGNAIVLTGPSRLAKGKLLERDSRKNQGVIQVFEDMNVLTLSLDDMAEWCGPLDDDLLE